MLKTAGRCTQLQRQQTGKTTCKEAEALKETNLKATVQIIPEFLFHFSRSYIHSKQHGIW